MRAAVSEVEAVVELGRVLPLRVLHDRLELVERFRELRFRRRRALVLIPQRSELATELVRQRVEQREQVAALRVALAGRDAGGNATRLLGRRHVAADRFAEVVNETDLDQPGEIDFGKLGREHERHEAQAPRVLGHRLRPSGRRVAASDRGLEPLGATKELDDAGQITRLH